MHKCIITCLKYNYVWVKYRLSMQRNEEPVRVLLRSQHYRLWLLFLNYQYFCPFLQLRDLDFNVTKMKIEVDSLWICNSDYKCYIQRNFKPNLICNGLHNWNIIGKNVPLRYSKEPELDISIFAPISHNRKLSLAPPSSYIAEHLTSFEQISFASKIEWTSFTYGKHQVLLVWEYPLPISVVNAYEIRYDNAC